MENPVKFDPMSFEDEAVLHKNWQSIEEVRSSNPIRGVTATCKGADKVVEVEWASGESQIYPCIWLRDHCRCKLCFHAFHQTRLTDFMEQDLDIGVKKATVNDDDQTIDITWSDDHQSSYPSNWLLCNRFDQTDADPIRGIESEYWDASTLKTNLMRPFKFEDIINSDQVLYDMQMHLKSVGLVFIQDTPTDKGHVMDLSERIGYICGTSYTKTTSQIYGKSEWAFGHPSYGLEFRPLHSDFSFIDDPQGVVAVQCVTQIDGEGGGYFFVDGYKAAEDIRKSDPKAFHLLTKPCWEGRVKGWVVSDKHYHHSVSAPIKLNDEGEVTKLTLCDFWRTSVMRLPVEQVGDAYRALRALYDTLYRKDHVYTHNLKPGDMFLIHNHRVLHGREEYHNTKPSTVHLETGYFNWDSFDTRMRKVKMNLDNKKKEKSIQSIRKPNGEQNNGLPR
ncbi:gamma-butyrobetaine dioxygenase-like [Lytechinus pictus]|uniref:gamma-butyrobetaine dioxygenase-like n=1 Tax=Lytechinus pictus TaxID=7653 RepID=UPI0030BA1A51